MFINPPVCLFVWYDIEIVGEYLAGALSIVLVKLRSTDNVASVLRVWLTAGYGR